MTTTVYKLMDARGCTRGNTQWGPDVEHTAPGGGMLCSEAYLHAYASPEQAAFMSPAYGYAGIDCCLWEGDADVEVDDGTKLGCTRLQTLREVPRVTLITEKRVKLALLCACQVPQTVAWLIWARNWWSGEDRTAASAAAAAAAAWGAAPAARAAWAAAAAAAWAAKAKASAAWAAAAAAADAADAVAADAADADAWAAAVAAWADAVAADAADAAPTVAAWAKAGAARAADAAVAAARKTLPPFAQMLAWATETQEGDDE
jgi:hypothetical protein